MHSSSITNTTKLTTILMALSVTMMLPTTVAQDGDRIDYQHEEGEIETAGGDIVDATVEFWWSWEHDTELGSGAYFMNGEHDMDPLAWGEGRLERAYPGGSPHTVDSCVMEIGGCDIKDGGYVKDDGLCHYGRAVTAAIGGGDISTVWSAKPDNSCDGKLSPTV